MIKKKEIRKIRKQFDWLKSKIVKKGIIYILVKGQIKKYNQEINIDNILEVTLILNNHQNLKMIYWILKVILLNNIYGVI